ncbi:uncharacterized protein LOC129915936 [Episyrphus balteatus]|uniref:uncharacterized protein LOC129915936 n=1 Tax=Episyrphus balteatus TaxID=286459 RepID=UPI0024858C76|nr:uncharacterized protein LOC129915936 [Episyrphus balteatus]
MDWAIGNEWKDSKRGLYKKILAIKFVKLHKPTTLSICRVKISNISSLEDRQSSYLRQIDEFDLEMGSAVTPVDCYIEILVQNMLLGEASQCQIKSKSGEPINFEISLIAISPTKYLFQLNVKEIYDLAQKYRANGVEMFKTYPKFAHEYFCRAAKCLISFKPFDVLAKESNELDGTDMKVLLQTLQTNIAACLLQEQRFEDVLCLTEFVNSMSPDEIKDVEKALYRRALAYSNVKAYDKVLATLDKVDNIRDKKEFMALYNRTKENWKRDEDHYKSIVQRMFNKR